MENDKSFRITYHCQCGSFCRNSGRARHFKSKKHQEYHLEYEKNDRETDENEDYVERRKQEYTRYLTKTYQKYIHSK